MQSSEESPFLTLGLSESGERHKAEPKPALPKHIAEWKLESELACPMPRHIVLRRDYIRTLIGIALSLTIPASGLFVTWRGFKLDFEDVLFGAALFAALIALCFHFDRRDRELSRLLVSRGTATRGIIVEKKWIFVPRGNSHSAFVIAYDTPARRYITIGKLFLGSKGWEVGDTHTVLYSPESPERAILYEDCAYKAVLPPEECR